MAQLSAWQDYAAHKLYLQQISIPLTVRNNICILPGKTGVLSLTLQPNKTSFTPRHTIIGKGIAYVKPFDQNLPLRPIEIEFENNCFCIEIHNTSDSTVEFVHDEEMAYFDARSKGLVQINNFCKTLSDEGRTEETHTKRNGQTRAFRYYPQRTDQLQLTGCLSEMKKSKFIPSLQ